MKDNNKGSMIILTIIGIATLLVAVIGATFAYFTVQIQGNVTEATVQVQSSTMLVQFETKNKIEYTGAIPGRPTADDNIANKLKFTLKSHKDLGVATNYKVYLVVENNEFLPTPNVEGDIANELVYVASQTSEEPQDILEKGATATINYNKPQMITTIYNNVESEEFQVGSFTSATLVTEDDLTTEEDEEVITPITNEKVLIGSGKLGSNESVDTWEIEVWLKEIQSEQNYNQGRNMTAHVEIEVEDRYSHEDVTTP